MDSRAPHPLRVLIANERKERLQTTTGLVAAMGHEGDAGTPHHLAPGTGVLLYADGVTEARHKGDQFGQTRLAQLVKAPGRRPVRRRSAYRRGLIGTRRDRSAIFCSRGGLTRARAR
jgi:Stage II sporulation protein E (SpoIIE)